MADGTTLSTNVGVGDKIATDDLGATGKAQWVKLMDGTDGSAAVIPGDATNGLRVDVNNAAVADGGTLPAKGVQIGGTDGSVFQVMSTDNAGRPNVNVNGTVPVSIAATQAVNAAQVAGTTTDTNSGVKSAGTQRVVLATDQPQLTNALKVDGSAVTQPVSGTVTATLGATTNAGATVKTSDYDTGAGTDTVTSFGIALPASGGAVQGGTATNPVRTDPTGTTTQPVSGTVTASGPLTDTQLRASAVPVSLAAAPSTAVTNAGTFAVQDSEKVADNAGFTDGTTKVQPAGFIFDETAGTALTENDAAAARVDSKRAQVLVLEDATTRGQRATVSAANALKVDGSAVTQPVSGTVTSNLAASASATGFSKSHLVSAATTNATNVKASAGKLHGWYIYNSNAAARKVAFHNTAGTPTAGSGVTDSLVIPPASAANAFTETGIAFSTGIAFTTVTDLTDAGTTAVGASDLVINLWYI
jgi:hypothetical protein